MHGSKTRSTNIPAFFMRLLLLLASTTFSVNALADPQIVNPSAGSTLSGSAQTFTWNIDGAGVERVWLYVGTTAGGRDIASSGDLGLDTTYNVIGIPMDGSTIHARLWYYSTSRWFYVDSSYTAANLNAEVSSPAMDSPANNSVLAGASVDFTWHDNNTLVNYWWLYLGTTQGDKDLYDSGGALRARTSVTVGGLPVNGSPVYARLWFRTTDNGWQYADSMYRANNDDTTQPPPSVGCTASPSEVQKSTVYLINQVRSQGRMCGNTFFANAPPVVWSSTLATAASAHSTDMAQLNFFSHTGSDGLNVGQRATNQGYIWRTIGENIAAGQRSTAEIVEGWTNSPGHCSNLMNPNFKDIAVACTENNTSQYGRYWTNMLGTRR